MCSWQLIEVKDIKKITYSLPVQTKYKQTQHETYKQNVRLHHHQFKHFLIFLHYFFIFMCNMHLQRVTQSCRVLAYLPLSKWVFWKQCQQQIFQSKCSLHVWVLIINKHTYYCYCYYYRCCFCCFKKHFFNSDTHCLQAAGSVKWWEHPALWPLAPDDWYRYDIDNGTLTQVRWSFVWTRTRDKVQF